MAEISTKTQIMNDDNIPINPATQETSQSILSTLQTIAAECKPLSGAGVAGTVILTLADTWYQVPSSVPVSDYSIVVSQEVLAGTMRWAYAGASAPSASYGNQFSGKDLILEMSAGQFIYVGSSSALDSVNWTTKVI